MPRVRLFHWDADEAKKKAGQLRNAGYVVSLGPFERDTLRQMKTKPPDAVIIDLSRLPSHGRDIAIAIRRYKRTRHVPLIFMDGEREKVDRIKCTLPDARYSSWRRFRSAVKQAIADSAADPVVPPSGLSGYAGTPLPKKLGIKENSLVGLAGAPNDFESTLGKLPRGASLRRRFRSRCDLIIWFVKSQDSLIRRIERMGNLAGKGGLWIAWPKKASGVSTDLTQAVVRKIGLAAGLVDYKVCAIDTTWTGLRFTKRKR
jgi:CheY-like chemotaxis protein